MSTTLTPQGAARTALACLDLTRLNDHDSEADVAQLCARAQGPHGPVAAVCVWPRLAAFARRELPSHIAVAAVANFPHGGDNIESAVRDTALIVDSGAQEVDLVLPFPRLLAGGEAHVAALLVAVRQACTGLRLKVILETGVLADSALIARACALSLAHGADFLKTSTGKTPLGATPEAARVMLGAIAADPLGSHRVGFKVSGGVRTVADAALYMTMCEEWLGPQALHPQRFRIGASSLLNDIEATLGGTPHTAAAPAAY